MNRNYFNLGHTFIKRTGKSCVYSRNPCFVSCSWYLRTDSLTELFRYKRWWRSVHLYVFQREIYLKTESILLIVRMKRKSNFRQVCCVVVKPKSILRRCRLLFSHGRLSNGCCVKIQPYNRRLKRHLLGGIISVSGFYSKRFKIHVDFLSVKFRWSIRFNTHTCEVNFI